MKRSITKVGFVCLIPLLLVGCGGDDGRTDLVVYSPHGRDVLEAFETRFERTHPNADMHWVDMGSQQVLDRLRSERANPQADVWFGAPSPMFERAADAGLLARYVPEWSAAVPAEARDDEGYWHVTYLTPEVIAYNSAVVSREEAPKDWDEVLDPRWDGHVLIRDPLASGTMRAIFGMILYRSVQETGSPESGFDWLRRLDAQTKEYVLNPTLLYQKLAREEGLVTLWTLPDIEMLKDKAGFPIDYVLPESGTPVVMDAIAVVEGSPHQELAREFVDFIGSQSNVLYAVREFFRVPARTDLPADSLPGWLRDARADLVPEPLDWAFLQENLPEWMRRWDDQVRGQGS